MIGVPVSNVAGIGNGARHGILLKGSEVIGDFSRVDTMVFDKTGTLTVGNPSVAEKAYYGDKIDEALMYLASVESESDHPLAKAVLEEIGEITSYPVGGHGSDKRRRIIASVDGHRIAVGICLPVGKGRRKYRSGKSRHSPLRENGTHLY